VHHLRDKGGAIVNVASALADRAIPLQGTYGATKHALKAWTDSLRMELEEERAPISLTLIKPASVDTPLFRKAKTLLGVEPRPIPPVYAPEVVAHAILEALQHPMRDMIAGGRGRMAGAGEHWSPRLTDVYMEHTMFDSQRTETRVTADRPSNLYAPVTDDGGERGQFDGRVIEWSAYTEAALHPRRAAGVVAAAGLSAIAIAAGRRFRPSRRRRG
jgi:hypothetical protein